MSVVNEKQEGSNITNFNFKEWKERLIGYLYDKIKSNQIRYDDFSEAVKEYRDLGVRLQEILELGYQISRGDDSNRIFELYREFLQENAGKMVEQLRRLGFEIRTLASTRESYKNILDDLSSQSYRILEKTRHARRSEVQYLITRIFVVNKEKIPRRLSRVFNPRYSDELFKTFVYSFLSGVLSDEQRGSKEL